MISVSIYGLSICFPISEYNLPATGVLMDFVYKDWIRETQSKIIIIDAHEQKRMLLNYVVIILLSFWRLSYVRLYNTESNNLYQQLFKSLTSNEDVIFRAKSLYHAFYCCYPPITMLFCCRIGVNAFPCKRTSCNQQLGQLFQTYVYFYDSNHWACGYTNNVSKLSIWT